MLFPGEINAAECHEVAGLRAPRRPKPAVPPQAVSSTAETAALAKMTARMTGPRIPLLLMACTPLMSLGMRLADLAGQGPSGRPEVPLAAQGWHEVGMGQSLGKPAGRPARRASWPRRARH